MLLQLTNWFVQSKDWIGPLGGLVAAGAAAVAAWISWRTKMHQVAMTRAAIQPSLAFTGVISTLFADDGLQFQVQLTNTGTGPAHLLAIDCERLDVTANVGTPLNISPGHVGEIRLWCPGTELRQTARLSVYYWDLNWNCYRTELHVVLEGTEYFLERDRRAPVTAGFLCWSWKKRPPNGPRHWHAKQSNFHPPWWKKSMWPR